MAEKVLFPAVVVAFQKELAKWPEIQKKAQEGRDLGESLGIIAAELNIILDGIYDPVDLIGMLLVQLRQKGEIVVLQKMGSKEINVPNMTLKAPFAEVPEHYRLGGPVITINGPVNTVGAIRDLPTDAVLNPKSIPEGNQSSSD